jgi:hypothetical protein
MVERSSFLARALKQASSNRIGACPRKINHALKTVDANPYLSQAQHCNRAMDRLGFSRKGGGTRLFFATPALAANWSLGTHGFPNTTVHPDESSPPYL